MKVGLAISHQETISSQVLPQLIIELSKLIVIVNIVIQACFYYGDMAIMTKILNFHPTIKMVIGLSLFLPIALLISAYTLQRSRASNSAALLVMTTGALLLHLLNLHELFLSEMGVSGIKWWLLAVIFSLYAVKTLEGITHWFNYPANSEPVFQPSERVQKNIKLYWQAFLIALTPLLIISVW